MELREAIKVKPDINTDDIIKILELVTLLKTQEMELTVASMLQRIIHPTYICETPSCPPE